MKVKVILEAIVDCDCTDDMTDDEFQKIIEEFFTENVYGRYTERICLEQVGKSKIVKMVDVDAENID